MQFVFRTNEQRGILESSLNAVCFLFVKDLTCFAWGLSYYSNRDGSSNTCWSVVHLGMPFCIFVCFSDVFWRRQRHPTPVLLPGKSHGWRSLVGCSPWGRARLNDFSFTFHFHALEKEMATHSSVLAWRIPGTREPGGLLSMGSHRVRHDWSDLAAADVFLSHCD